MRPLITADKKTQTGKERSYLGFITAAPPLFSNISLQTLLPCCRLHIRDAPLVLSLAGLTYLNSYLHVLLHAPAAGCACLFVQLAGSCQDNTWSPEDSKHFGVDRKHNSSR